MGEANIKEENCILPKTEVAPTLAQRCKNRAENRKYPKKVNEYFNSTCNITKLIEHSRYSNTNLSNTFNASAPCLSHLFDF